MRALLALALLAALASTPVVAAASADTADTETCVGYWRSLEVCEENGCLIVYQAMRPTNLGCLY
jgi:hypothetical protein